MANEKKYIALDHFHKTGLGTVGPASGSFVLEDHDAKVLLERGLVKEVSDRKLNAALPDKSTAKSVDTIISDAVNVAAKAVKGAPENKKRDTKASNK